jgi:AbrB family looped-hinge helix DNA binding protein
VPYYGLTRPEKPKLFYALRGVLIYTGTTIRLEIVTMAARTTKMTRKGQITIPIAIRDALNMRQGDTLMVEQDNNKVVVQRARDTVERTAGIFASYSRGKPNPAAEREQFEQDLADEVYETYETL